MRDEIYFSLQNKVLDARNNISAIQRRLNIVTGERDKAEQSLRNLQYEYDKLLAKYNEVISK